MSWTEALQEAYASAPAEEYVIPTLELIHAAFVTVESPTEPDSIRIALDDCTWFLELEPNAPLRGGQIVMFEPLAIRFVPPQQEEGRFGTAKMAIDNVPTEYIGQLEEAASIRSPAKLIYREWLAVESGSPAEYQVSGPPDYVLGELTVKVVEANLLTLEGDATFVDLLNKGFPRRRFTREEFPALFGGDVE